MVPKFRHTNWFDCLEPRLLLSGTPAPADLSNLAREVDLLPAGSVYVDGDITRPGQQDHYQLTALAKGRLDIRMQAGVGEIDPYLQVANQKGRRVRRNDNASRQTLDSAVGLRVRPGATYFVIASGDGAGGSYRLKFTGDPVDEKGEIWTLTKIDLREGSIVSIGANDHATIAAVKSERRVQEIADKLRAGDRPTEREFEDLLKGSLGFSNAQAERAVRVLLKGQGEPGNAADGLAFLRALAG